MHPQAARRPATQLLRRLLQGGTGWLHLMFAEECEGVTCRIKHTHVLDDPFPDPPQLAEHTPAESPPLVRQEEDDRLEDDWAPDQDTRPAEVIEEETK